MDRFIIKCIVLCCNLLIISTIRQERRASVAILWVMIVSERFLKKLCPGILNLSSPHRVEKKWVTSGIEQKPPNLSVGQLQQDQQAGSTIIYKQHALIRFCKTKVDLLILNCWIQYNVYSYIESRFLIIALSCLFLLLIVSKWCGIV